MLDSTSLIRKYNVPTPRYTSYPTVPCWDTEEMNHEIWAQHVRKAFRTKGEAEGISLYIHLPFCESLCTYCGCNTRITVNHAVELVYIHALLTEWLSYVHLFGKTPTIKEVHLGGGTPTFFSAEHLELLLAIIFKNAQLSPDAELSFEGHPNNTTEQHLRVLYEVGFRRVSFGIQDFDPTVQKTIHRIQSFGQVEYVTDLARMIGYTSINYDLIYGLPKQTQESVKNTIEKVKLLQPDRIAFYSYAHVPWAKPGQRGFSEADLPNDEAKLALYETGRQLLTDAGYEEIGMDHFALRSDALYQAMLHKTLHRNFMGYTVARSTMLIGLGCSAISDVGTAYAQNHKGVEPYMQSVEKGSFAIGKGHLLSEEDLYIRKHILDICCQQTTELSSAPHSLHANGCMDRLADLEEDGLLHMDGLRVTVTPTGRRFLRNICAALDIRMHEKQIHPFSKAV